MHTSLTCITSQTCGELAAFEDVYIALILVGEIHHVVAVEGIGFLICIRPASEIAERGETLGGARAEAGAVVGHEECGSENSRARRPRIRWTLAACARNTILVQDPR